MSGQSWTVNSDASLEACKKWLTDLYAEHKYLTVAKPRLGKDRSLDQNALFHVWCGEIAAHFMGVSRRLVDKGDINGVKRTVKKMFYQAHPETHEWMIYTVKCRLQG